MWALFESVHAVTYFAPEARASYEAAGLHGYWRGYFAGRVAPLGQVPAQTVTALFFSFAPAMVARAIPSIWSLVTPDEALRARSTGAVEALGRLLAPVDAGTVAEAADLIVTAAAHADLSGRALGAANAAVPVPDEPLARLWQATTTLRELRGDGHVAALVAAGLSGAEAVALRCALDGDPQTVQPYRGWTDEQWGAALAALGERGLVDEAGAATVEGRALYERVEQATDRAASAPWRGLGSDATRRLAELLAPLARAARAVVPQPNPIKLPPLPA
ncbi:MAG TPA: hypothetical protein VF054_07465 [Micromonosporaceae bacterium]